MMRAFLVDDEELALRRLTRLLQESGSVEVAGSASDPREALRELERAAPDVLFLDIEMPGLSGFELLDRLPPPHPFIVFTTAFDRYALKAFEVNSIDYLLKPIEPRQLERALAKLDRMQAAAAPRPRVDELLRNIASALQTKAAEYPERLASRVGDKLEFVQLSRVTHIYADQKMTYAATGAKNYCVDATIVELEQKLDPRRFVRIHRSTIVNIDYVQELYTWFAGRMLLRLKDKTELSVARDRVRELKQRLSV